VKRKIQSFIEETQVDEIIAVTHVYSFKDRLKSYTLLADIMEELNIE